jgi:hypothetical protein
MTGPESFTQRRESEKALDWELRRAWTVDFGVIHGPRAALANRSWVGVSCASDPTFFIVKRVEAPAMRFPRVQFTVRWMMVASHTQSS